MDLETRMKIINAFKAAPGLWLKSCDEFKKLQRNPSLKDNLWIQVVKSLVESGLKVKKTSELKKAWSHMRIQFMAYLDPSQQKNKDVDYELQVHEKLMVLSEMFLEKSNRPSNAPKKSNSDVKKSVEQPSFSNETPILDETLPPKESVVPDSQEPSSIDITLPVTQPLISTEAKENPQNGSPKRNCSTVSEDTSNPKFVNSSPSSKSDSSRFNEVSALPPIPRHLSPLPSEKGKTTNSNSAWNRLMASKENTNSVLSPSPSETSNPGLHKKSAGLSPISKHTEPTSANHSRTSNAPPRNSPMALEERSSDNSTPSNRNSGLPMKSSAPPPIPKHNTAPSANVSRKRMNTDDISEVPRKKSVSIAIQTENSRPKDARVSMSANDLRSLKITFSSDSKSRIVKKVDPKNTACATQYDPVAETVSVSQSPSLPPSINYMNSSIPSQYSATLPPFPSMFPLDPSQFMASMQMMMSTPYDTVHQTMFPMFGNATFYDTVATQRTQQTSNPPPPSNESIIVIE